MFKFRLCHQALSWPLISSFWFTQEDILTVAKKVCLVRRFSMEVLYLVALVSSCNRMLHSQFGWTKSAKVYSFVYRQF